MEGSPTPTGFRQAPHWFLALGLVLLGQAGLALDLFGPDGSWTRLTDDRPITSGRHPLHLYHGMLGAETFRERFSTSCYDPAYQAGYPKTPIFDGGCRPAEMFLLLVGSHIPPATAYKLGLFAVCLLAPLAFAIMARGMGLPAPSACLAAVGGTLVWWSPPIRAMLEAGNVDLLLAGLMGLIFLGGLVRYASHPGILGWFCLAGSATLGWYAHPVVWVGLVPVLALYYVALAPKHGVAWHLGIVGVTAAGLAPNLWWLWDWGKFWWLRQPSVDDYAPLPSWVRLVGGTEDYLGAAGCGAAGWAITGLGLAGLVSLARTGHRVAAGVLVLSATFSILVARLGSTWQTLQVVSGERIAPFAFAVLVIPAAYLVGKWWAGVRGGPTATLVVVLVPLVLGWVRPISEPGRAILALDLSPFRVGFSGDQEDLILALRQRTSPDARILVEELEPSRPGWNWTALLASQTDRSFLGGLDSEACVEHSFCGQRGGRLNGRPLADWTQAERAAFCRRYNVGWVLCRTSAAIEWWSSDPCTRELGRYRDGGEVVLFELDRPRNYVRVGSANVIRLDRQKIILSDVVPDPATGTLVLSLHHQPGIRVTPSVVRVERDPDPFDPIPMIKLLVPGPTSRIVLTWENP